MNDYVAAIIYRDKLAQLRREADSSRLAHDSRASAGPVSRAARSTIVRYAALVALAAMLVSFYRW